MMLSLDLKNLRKVRPSEYLFRLAFGGLITGTAGLGRVQPVPRRKG
jgi:hypothetical protein